jgi:RNA polymerase sigma factor (sigma-70 family)
MTVESQSSPRLTRSRLDRLLKRLAEESDAEARDYRVVRRRLVGFFERRGVAWADALADETIDRVARRLGEGEAILHLNGYFYGVARLVLLEWRRRQDREDSARRQHAPLLASQHEDGSPVQREKRLACLEECLRKLPRDSRSLIVKYHKVRLEARQALAEELGITYTSLKTRAHRIRLQLAGCLSKCLGTDGGDR